jgi:TRAP-type transport system periplasmic protein
VRVIAAGFRAFVVAALGLAASSLTFGAARADDKPFLMKITLATMNDAIHQYARNLAAAIEKDSGGRIKAEIYPGSQLGSISRQAEGVQFGAIQCQVVPPEFLVGIDERFEVLAAPGLVDSMEHGQRLAAQPDVLQLMLGLGAAKGMHGAGLFMVNPSAVIGKTPIRHLADFKGRKIRIFASQFQSVAFDRLGATPIAMTLADVLPALQQGAIDGAVASDTIFNNMHYQDAAKYITETGQPAIFAAVEISARWYATLPADLQETVDRTTLREALAINPQATAIHEASRQSWASTGGELISLPAGEQAAMMTMLASVGADVSQAKPELSAAYQIVTEAAQRTR